MISKTFKAILIIFFSYVLSSCGGGDSGGSSSSEEGIKVTFAAIHQQTPDATLQVPVVPAGVPRTFLNSEGVRITLTKAYLVMWRIQLESDCTSQLFTQLWHSLFTSLLPPVMAHTETTPTQLGVPNVIDFLTADSTELELGSINPPPGNYCGMTVELLKADADTQRLPTAINMVNRVLYLEGQYLPVGSSQPVPFTINLAKTPLPRHLRLVTPLTLSSDHRTARLVTSIHYDRWFDALNLAALEEATQQDWLLNNIVSSLHNR
jgi:hypothetical protein